MLAEDFSALVRSRHTVRDFLPEPVPQPTLDAILDDARYCASWSNTRAYCVAIASGAQRDRLSARYVAAYNASLQEGRGRPDGDFTVWREYPDELKPRSQKVGKGLYTAMGVPRGDKAAREAAARRNLEFFGAPTVLWLFVHKGMLPFSAQDGGILLDTLMLSAQAHGVDTCPIGTLAVWRGPIDEEFDIPKDYQFITGLAFGYASDAPANQFRAEHPTLTVVPAR